MSTFAPTTTDVTYLPLTEDERGRFERDGVVLTPGALDPDSARRTADAVERVYEDERRAGRLRADNSMHLLGVLDRDPALLDLVDNPTTFRWAWGLLGWNIYSQHNHIDVHPGDPYAPALPWGWHQDGDRQNCDIDEAVRPMLSIKVAFVLSDLSETGRGATQLIVGSHRANTLAGRPARRGEPYIEPPGATEIVAHPGDAFVFDRRLWHARTVNRSAVTRKLVFVGYTYRWIRPQDDVDYRRNMEWFSALSPLRRQLLGDGSDVAQYWGTREGWWDDSIPLRAELGTRGLLDASRPYLR